MPIENAHRRYLAELPNNWSISEVRSLGSIVGGSTPSRAVSRFWNGNIPWVTPGEMTALGGAKFLNDTKERITRAGYESCGTRLLPPGSLLITTRATLGLVALSGSEVSTNQGFKSLVFCRDNYPDFYFHLFHRLKPEMERLGSGTTFLEISAGDFGRITVPVPPPSEQRAIAAVLDTIDAAIQKTEQIIAKLQQVKQGLLHELLTRGIDDNGELRDPERHPEQFQDSPLGRIPKGWEVKPFGKCFWLQRGFDITVAEQRTGNVPVVSSSGISSYHDKPMVEGPGVVTGRKGKLGAVYYVSVPFWPHDTSLWVKDFFGNDREFACLFIGSFRLERFDAATSVPTLNRNTVHPLLIALPRLAEQRLIVEKQQALDIRIAAENGEHSKLSALKSSLCDDLLTGRVRTTSLPEFAA